MCDSSNASSVELTAITGGIGPDGSSSGFAGVKAAATKVFVQFCNTVVPPLRWPSQTEKLKGATIDERLYTKIRIPSTTPQQISTPYTFLQQYAKFLVEATKTNGQHYAHQTLEGYLNATILVIERATTFKFDDKWQSDVVNQIVRTVINRIMAAGSELPVKHPIGKEVLKAMSMNLFQQDTALSMKVRLSFVMEWIAAGRTAESQLAMLSDIRWDRDKGVFTITWREGKTSKYYILPMCQVPHPYSMLTWY